ncbi:hypothetical protein [Gordonia otitidis]|uniref:hypothetical protein n=1 Tax=Gordonia otitidis TaxID=249058 RepID=UPI002357891D|nr:hypothetical protein [Gordonia otitidis]
MTKVWHRQVDTGREFMVDAEMSGIIEACWARGWVTRYCCQGGPMWGRGGPRLAYIMFADRTAMMRFIGTVAQRLSRDALVVDDACEAVVRFGTPQIPEIERVLAEISRG